MKSGASPTPQPPGCGTKQFLGFRLRMAIPRAGERAPAKGAEGTRDEGGEGPEASEVRNNLQDLQGRAEIRGV